MTPPKSGVKVRMYRTGLGDCFLLVFPRKRRSRNTPDAFTMLIDCGVFKATQNAAERTERIARSIRDATRPSHDPAAPGRIDLLVITHEHWDHISAFDDSQARDIFSEIDFRRIWMAWTEDPQDKVANNLQHGLDAARFGLTAALVRSRGLGLDVPSTRMLGKALAFFGIDGEALDGPAQPPGPTRGRLSARDATALALKTSKRSREVRDWIRDDLNRDRKLPNEYLRPCDKGRALPLDDDVPNVRVYVLGPPEDPGLIKYFNPRASDETQEVVYERLEDMHLAGLRETSFLAAFGASGGFAAVSSNAEEDGDEIQQICIPFEARHRIPREAVEFLNWLPRPAEKSSAPANGTDPTPALHDYANPMEDHVEAARYCADMYYSPSSDWRRVDGDWLDGADELALQLDSATNNTSLAIAIEVGEPGSGHVLLFPGDAQVGSWKSWFGKVESKGRGGDALELGKEMRWTVAGKSIDTPSLIRRTVLYKVGHHGSHNATLKRYKFDDGGDSILEHMSDRLVALLPVDEEVAKNKADYGEMPLTSLVVALLEKTKGRLLRNDKGAGPPEKPIKNSTLELMTEPPPSFKFRETELYFEFTIEPGP
jgi:hypothetical protein